MKKIFALVVVSIAVLSGCSSTPPEDANSTSTKGMMIACDHGNRIYSSNGTGNIFVIPNDSTCGSENSTTGLSISCDNGNRVYISKISGDIAVAANDSTC